eukprot:TRINITY_DN17845_c0_g1_i2.p1 TRINITY_DN17845_c0_g1~~TRINITY_DN17845_c0_g1_i2.p1  ORF type:complete len:654 (-),score=83.92 TRINITY_DN17845_c0_g1_i2:39-1931(-)
MACGLPCAISPIRLLLLAAFVKPEASADCPISPSLHPPEAYTVSPTLWEKVNILLQQYAEELGACENQLLPSVHYYMLNMSDGAQLNTAVINPSFFGEKKGAVLCRSPYGPTSKNLADIFILSNGYVAVLQDDRGTFSSTGEFDMWRGSPHDTLETMEWITRQDWSNGDVYTVGISADGISAATVIFESPKMIRGQWFMDSTFDGHNMIFPNGVYRMDLIENYMKVMNYPVHRRGQQVIQDVRHHEPWSPWWMNLTACRDTAAPPPACHYSQITWPIILTAGWWDIFSTTMLDAFEGARAFSDPSVRDKHVLVVGPLGHCAGGWPLHPIFEAAEGESIKTSMSISSEIFGSKSSQIGGVLAQVKRLNFFVMGAYDSARAGNYWTSLDDWPTTIPKQVFLVSGSRLGAKAEAEPGNISYIYDPSSPTPMIGGNNLPLVDSIPVCGSADQLERDKRSDVVVFDGEVLEENIPIVGRSIARLFVSSSARDTDFIVTVEDVRPANLLYKETSYMVRFGAVRMRWRNSDVERAEPMVDGQVYEVAIDLGYTAYIFEKGHSIRVTVSSAANPYFNPNYNVGEFEVLDPTLKPVVASNTIHIGGATASFIQLPVVRMEDIPRNAMFGASRQKMATIV